MASLKSSNGEYDTQSLLSWARHICWFRGLYHKAPTFNPLLFSGDLGYNKGQAESITDEIGQETSLPKEPWDYELWDETLWESRELLLTDCNQQDVQNKLRAELKRRFCIRGIDTETIRWQESKNILEMFAQLEAAEDEDVHPSHARADAAAVAAAFGYNITSTAQWPGPLIKIVLGTLDPDGTGHARLVERQMFPDEDWADVRQTLENVAWQHGITIDSTWCYRIEARKEDKTDGQTFVLSTQQDWQQLVRATRGQHRGKAALIFQQSWKDALTRGRVTLPRRPSAKEPYEIDIIDTDGFPVFYKLSLDFLASPPKTSCPQPGENYALVSRRLKLPLRVSDISKARMRDLEDAESLALLDMVQYLEENRAEEQNKLSPNGQ